MTEFKARLHSGQMQVHNSSARFKVLACGRRWGKTRLGVNECLGIAARGGRAWWVAPSYKMSEVGWRPLRQIATRIEGVDVRRVDRQIVLPGGGEVSVRSADNPDSLRGDGLDLVVVDECAFVIEEAWTEALRPALSDRQGAAMFISTPKGRNWFWRAYMRGQDGNEAEWQSWRFPTASNPYIQSGEIEAARKMLPELAFQQEYLAEFLEDSGLVFRNIRACIALPPSGPEPGRAYVMGVDWAQSHDFTVLTVMDVATRQVVEIDRFNQIGWDVQRGRLAAMARRWNVQQILAEQNSIGGPNIEQLQSEGLPVRAFQTTNETKQNIVVALQLAFERAEIRIPDNPALIAELEAFEAERLPSGRWRYQAAQGMHDDMVISLALALEAANTSATVGMRQVAVKGRGQPAVRRANGSIRR